MIHGRWCATVLCIVVISASQQDAEGTSTSQLQAEYQQLSGKFAASVPGWRPQAPVTGALMYVAPDEYTPAGDMGERFRQARNEYAAGLFELAKRAATAGQSSLAFQWATETLRENPDHVDARRVLGYEQRDGRWLTTYGARMAEDGKVWHARFGWVSPADVPRYQAGERWVNHQWISAERDAARRRDMKSGWQVRTEHFLVTTNHSLEAAAELAARLERLYQVWRQLFAGFYLTEREVQGLFAGQRPPRKQVRPFRVYYHRNRDQYAAELRGRQPLIDNTLGIYFDQQREAHFFAGSEHDLNTLHHEATHQLFQESKPTAKHVAALANFWVIEGVATYFETLRERADPAAGFYYTIGEWTAGRLPAARHRLQEGFYIPLAELTRWGKADLQGHAEVAKVYSQAAGFTAFLIDGEQGRYREPLVRYLAAVYGGRDSSDSLAELVGLVHGELDAQYGRYVQSLPASTLSGMVYENKLAPSSDQE
jgi:hypothetical protein